MLSGDWSSDVCSSDLIFTYLCSEIGETRDVYRFDIDQNDLENASDLFNMFKGAKAKFSTDDKRCKIVSFDQLYEGSHWCVDRWWSHDERIALGIEQEVKTIGLRDFRSMLADTASSIYELDEPLTEIEDSEMPIVASKTFLISDLFTIERGKGKYTKAYTQKHPGEYDVFSGNTFGEFAKIDTYDYDTPCLSWAIDGLAGYMMIHETPFSATNHRGVLVPKIENLDLNYVKYILEPIFRELKKGREGSNGENEYTSLPPFMIKKVSIDLPVDETGQLDMNAQKEISKKYLALEQYKQDIVVKLQALIDQKVTIDFKTSGSGRKATITQFDFSGIRDISTQMASEPSPSYGKKKE